MYLGNQTTDYKFYAINIIKLITIVKSTEYRLERPELIGYR